MVPKWIHVRDTSVFASEFLSLAETGSATPLYVQVTSFYVGIPDLSLMPRLLFTERENSLVNCLYRFGSNILKSL